MCVLSLLLELFYFISLYSVARSLANSSRWLLCFGRLSPLAFLDLVARIQGGREEKGRRRRGGGKAKLQVVVVVKQKEQGAQMAVDSRVVDKAVCWSPRGQYGNEI